MFSKLNFNIPDDILQDVAAGKPGVIEFILSNLRMKVSMRHASDAHVLPFQIMFQIEKFLEDRSKKQSFGYDSDTSGQYYDPSQMVSTYNNSVPDPWSQVMC